MKDNLIPEERSNVVGTNLENPKKLLRTLSFTGKQADGSRCTILYVPDPNDSSDEYWGSPNPFQVSVPQKADGFVITETDFTNAEPYDPVTGRQKGITCKVIASGSFDSPIDSTPAPTY